MPSLNAMIDRAITHGLIPASIQSHYVNSALNVLRENFELVPVTNTFLADQAARIRYEVYCQDYPGYEAASNFPDFKEKDVFDIRSLQVLLRFKPEAIDVGTVRLILPLSGDDYGNSYPTQKLCGDPLFHKKDYITKTCEVSRFCLSKQRRNSLQQYLSPSALGKVRRVLSVGLVAGIIKTAQEHGYDRLCGVLEPWLIAKLHKSGWHFNEIGPLVDYHGLRQPCEGSVSEGLTGIKEKYAEVWSYIQSVPPLWLPKYDEHKKVSAHAPNKVSDVRAPTYAIA